MSEPEGIKQYEDPFYIGERRDVEDQVMERDSSTFTISTGTFTLYDSGGTARIGPITDSDAAFDIDGAYLRYALNGTAGSVSADLHTVEWKYSTSTNHTFVDKFHLDIRAIP